tara:strand:+ start:48 stop:863 length:816 start_codon:yes stop_codon:yes gene_type:complete
VNTEIINKSTNQRCDYVSFDDILDISLLKNSFDEIYNSIVDKLNTTEDWQKFLVSREFDDNPKFEDIEERRLLLSLNDDTISEFPVIQKMITKLLGSWFGIGEVQVFFDSNSNIDESPVFGSDCHVDCDVFIWIKLNLDRTLTILERDEKELHNYKMISGDKFSYFCPPGYLHGPPIKGLGIAMRISLREEWFTTDNESKICNDMVKYIKEFNYKPRLSSGYFNFKLPFIDYTECDFRPGAQARFEAGDGFFFHWNKDDKRLLLKDNIEEF